MSKVTQKEPKSKSAAIAVEPKSIFIDETITVKKREKPDFPDNFMSSLMPDMDMDTEELEEKVKTILGSDDIDVSHRNLKKYLEYLKKNLKLPCQVEPIEEFAWEEPYVFGPGSKREYEKLAKTRPCYTDIFKLLGFQDQFFEEEGIMADVQRLSDNKKFTVPLENLEPTDENSPNYQLLDDYSAWFCNFF
jgi:hypothetical protein